jgi:hypothetical protein
MTVKIIENLLPICWQKGLQQTVKDLHWVHQKGTSYKVNNDSFIQGMDVFIDDNTVDSPQLVCYLIDHKQTNPVYPYIRPILYMLEDALGKAILRIIRIKINHQMPILGFNKDNYNIAHVDEPDGNLMSAVYYINDSDGDTFLFNEHYSPNKDIKKLTISHRITPQAGKIVFFPSTQMHASANPISTASRYVINFVFEVEK